jgi:hypothetical protein
MLQPRASSFRYIFLYLVRFPYFKSHLLPSDKRLQFLAYENVGDKKSFYYLSQYSKIVI